MRDDEIVHLLGKIADKLDWILIFLFFIAIGTCN